MWWQLIIVYAVRGAYGMEPTRIVRRSNTEKGFEWDTVDGESDHTYEFADSDGSWNAVYTNVVWFTEERFEQKVEEKEGEETGQEETTAQSQGESQGEETRP